MDAEDKKNLLVKFPEEQISSGVPVSTPIGASPNNPVDKAADFLPRALSSIKENFREAVFLFGMLGYIFIAAFGHMEKISNYIGYFLVFLIGVLFYKACNKITSKDILYWFVILILIIYILYTKFDISIIGWL